jgi:hypothetical protein
MHSRNRFLFQTIIFQTTNALRHYFCEPLVWINPLHRCNRDTFGAGDTTLKMLYFGRRNFTPFGWINHGFCKILGVKNSWHLAILSVFVETGMLWLEISLHINLILMTVFRDGLRWTDLDDTLNYPTWRVNQLRHYFLEKSNAWWLWRQRCSNVDFDWFLTCKIEAKNYKKCVLFLVKWWEKMI